MDRMRITKRQKKIFVIVGIVGSAFAVFILLIYLPLRSELAQLKNEFYKIESEVNEIKKIAKEGETLEEAIASLKDKLVSIDNKFPEQDEVILRELSGLASRLGIEVVSIKPQKKKTIQEINQAPVSIKGCSVEEMPVSMSLKAPYKTMGEFFKILKDDFPVFVRVDTLRMGKSGDKAKNILNVDLNLDTYLISQEAK